MFDWNKTNFEKSLAPSTNFRQQIGKFSATLGFFTIEISNFSVNYNIFRRSRKKPLGEFENFHALKNLEININDGEIVALEELLLVGINIKVRINIF